MQSTLKYAELMDKASAANDLETMQAEQVGGTVTLLDTTGWADWWAKGTSTRIMYSCNYIANSVCAHSQFLTVSQPGVTKNVGSATAGCWQLIFDRMTRMI